MRTGWGALQPVVLGGPLWCLTTALPSLQAYLHGLSQGELRLAGRAAVDQDGAHDVGGRDGLHILCDWQLSLLLATEGEGGRAGSSAAYKPWLEPHLSQLNPTATILAALHVKARTRETEPGLEAPAVRSKDLSSMRRPQVEAEKDSHKFPRPTQAPWNMCLHTK